MNIARTVLRAVSVAPPRAFDRTLYARNNCAMRLMPGSDLDVAFLEWLSHIHHDTTVFDNEVKNGSDAELKTYAQNSITAGNEHLDEAREFLAKLKK
jgi:hypothetical protein